MPGPVRTSHTETAQTILSCRCPLPMCPPVRAGAHRPDEGFTLLETLVSLAVLAVVAGSVSIFLVATTRIGHRASLQDTAAQVAIGGMETARGMRGAALLAGRAACDAVHPCDPPVNPVVNAYLGTQPQRWDAAGTGTPALATPDTPETVELDGVRYRRYYYLARCWQTAASDGWTADRPCTEAAAGTAHPAEYIRLVVAVTWPDAQCAGGTCGYATATLMSASPIDPYLES